MNSDQLLNYLRGVVDMLHSTPTADQWGYIRNAILAADNPLRVHIEEHMPESFKKALAAKGCGPCDQPFIDPTKI